MAAAGIVALALAVYAQSFRAPFQLDDLTSIVSNEYIRVQSLDPGSLSRAAFQDFRQNRPLSNLSFALNYYFNLLDPAGYHAVNFAALAITALLIGLWLSRLFTHLGFEPSRSRLAGWLAALVWALHPANVQAVTYVVQRHASLAGMFSIAGIYFFHLAQGKKSGRIWFQLVSAFSCLLALLSKETAVTLPAIMLAYKVCFFDDLKPGWPARNWKWLAALAAFYAGAGVLALRPATAGALFDFEGAPFTAWQKLLSAPRALFWSFSLVVFPVPQRLNLLHDFPASRSWLQPATTIFSWVLLGAVVFAAVRRARQWKIFSFAVAWFLAMNLVELMPLPIDLVNEQRLYLASLSVIAPAAGLAVLRPGKIRLAVGWMMVVALFFGFFTFARNRVWLSEESLWRDVTGKSPSVAMWWSHLCSAQIEAGKLKSAAHACSLALSLDPDLAEARLNLGNIFLQEGDFSRAEIEFQEVLKLKPGDGLGYFNLGLVKIAQNDLAAAKAMFAQAERLNPSEAKVYFNMGLVYEAAGEMAEAARLFGLALKQRPEWLAPRLKLTVIMAGLGRCREARELAKGAPARDPGLEALAAQCVERTP